MNLVFKIITFFITSGIVGAASVFLFGFMILGMNGFHESDANYGIYLYIIWAIVGSLTAGILSVLSIYLLENKTQLHIALSIVLSVSIFTIIGIIFNIVGVLAGFFAADYARTNF